MLAEKWFSLICEEQYKGKNFLFSQNQSQNYPLSHTASLNHVILQVEMCYPPAAARITLFSARTKNLPVSIHHNVYLSKTLSLFLFPSLIPSDITFFLLLCFYFSPLFFPYLSLPLSPPLLHPLIFKMQEESKGMARF